MPESASPPPFPEIPDPLPPVVLGGTINLLSAASGTGKTTWLAWFSRQLRDRVPLWGREWGPVPWQGIICSDRSWTRSTSRWFALEGVELPAYSLQDDRSFRKQRLRKTTDRISVFESCLTRLSPAGDGRFPAGSLIYVDPIALFLGGNLLDYDRCMVACSELREIAVDRGITLIGTVHSAKQKADTKDRYLRLQDRILGSAALFGYTDTQMYLASPEELDKDHYTFLWHPHHAPPALFKFTRHTERGTFVDGGQIDAKGLPYRDPRAGLQEDCAWLLQILSEPRSFIDLLAPASEHQWSRATLHRRLVLLEREGLVVKVKHGTYKRAAKH